MATTFASATKGATWAGTNKSVVPSKSSTPSTSSSTSTSTSTGIGSGSGNRSSGSGSGSRSGSGGGGGSKNIVSTSGAVTGVDTGSQSVAVAPTNTTTFASATKPATFAGTNVPLNQAGQSRQPTTNYNGFADMGGDHWTGDNKNARQQGLPTLTTTEAVSFGITQPALILDKGTSPAEALSVSSFVSSNYKPVGVSNPYAQPYGTLGANQKQIDALTNIGKFQYNPQEYAKNFPSNVDITTMSVKVDGGYGEQSSYSLKDIYGGAYVDNKVLRENAPVGLQVYSRVEDIGIGIGKVAFGLPVGALSLLPTQQDPTKPTDFTKIYGDNSFAKRVLTSPNSVGTFVGTGITIAGLTTPTVLAMSNKFTELKKIYGLTNRQALGGIAQETVRTFNPISFKTTGVFNFKVKNFATRQTGANDILNINLGNGKSTIGGSSTTTSLSRVSYDTVIPTGLYTTKTIPTVNIAPTVTKVGLTPFTNMFVTNKGVTTGYGTRTVTTLGYEYVPSGNYGLTSQAKISYNLQGFTTQGSSIQTNFARLFTKGTGSTFDAFAGKIGTDVGFVGKKTYGGGESRTYFGRDNKINFGMGEAKFTNILRVEQSGGVRTIFTNAGRSSKATSVSTSVLSGTQTTPFGKANIYKSGSSGFTKSGKGRTFADYNIIDINSQANTGGYKFDITKISGGSSKGGTSQITKTATNLLSASKTSAVTSTLTAPKPTSITSIVKPTTLGLGAGLVSVTSLKTVSATTTLQSPVVKTTTSQVLLQAPKTETLQQPITKVITRTRSGTTQLIAPIVAPIVTPVVAPPFVTPIFRTPTPNAPREMPLPTIFPPFALPSFTSGKTGIKVGESFAKRKYSYTPSYKALVFGIKGKQPKKAVFSGLEIRPITKKFKWSSILN